MSAHICNEMLSFEIIPVIYWPIISYLPLETTLPAPILGAQPPSQFLCVFNMINKLKSYSLIFYILLSCLEWIAVLNCQENINYLDNFWVFSSTYTMTLTWTCVISLIFLGYGQTLHVFITFEEKLLVKLCSYLSCLQRNLSL